jgi:hypothetical protein
MRVKRKLEALATVVGLLITAAVVGVWLWLIVQGRSPPDMLVALAVISIAGALGAAYKIEDVREVLSLLPFKFKK